MATENFRPELAVAFSKMPSTTPRRLLVTKSASCKKTAVLSVRRMRGWASRTRWRKVVPDLGTPTRNNGRPSTGLVYHLAP
jgi:hypothetical protein